MKLPLSKAILTVLLLVIVLPTDAVSSNYVNYACPRSDYSYSFGSEFQTNLNYTLLNLLPSNASLVASSNFSIGQGIDQLHALYFCRGELDVGDNQYCHDCVRAAAQTVLQQCALLKEGIVWYEECTLRYANRTILSVEEEVPMSRYYNYSTILSPYHLDKYEQVFERTMNGLINQAAYNQSLHGFATREVNLSASSDQLTLRGLVQCSPDIMGTLCERCLRAALRQRDSWSSTIIFLPSCNVRFDVYGSVQSAPPTSGSGRKLPILVIILVPIGGVLLLLLLLLGFLMSRCCKWGPQRQGRERTDRLARFKYSDITDMTNGFERQLGEGAFGVVYYGRLTDDREVAVKMLYPSNLASEQFKNEIKLLKAVHHRNLVPLIGYCEERTSLALIYEYMACGNLQTLLTGPDPLSWKKRLEIAIDAAQGLDYLHRGCRPPIVHRDVKTANILLNQDLQAKIADFGVCKMFPNEYQPYVSTRVMGTPGYLDPEYHVTEHLNEKSDVYSFGVVLLELITGKGVIIYGEAEARTKLVDWVRPMVDRGDIHNIVDQRLQEVHKYRDSIWTAIEISMKCVKPTAEERPTMTDILTELRALMVRMDAVTVEMTRPVISSSIETSPTPR